MHGYGNGPSLLDCGEIGIRRTVDHFAQPVEARPMARAVPGLLDGIPRNDAPEMWAHGRALVEHVAFIAKYRDFLEAPAHHRAFACGDLLLLRHLAGPEITLCILRGDVDVLLDEISRRSQLYAPWVV